MIMLKGVGVDPLPIYKREPAARDGAYLYVPDPDALAPDSEMSWKKQPLASLPPVAGGKPGLTLRAEYNSKLWDTVRTERQSDPLDPATKYVVSNLQLDIPRTARIILLQSESRSRRCLKVQGCTTIRSSGR